MNSEKTCKDCGKPSKTFIKCFACNQKGKPKQEPEDNDIILTTLQLAKLNKAIASGGMCRIILCGGTKPNDPVKIVVEREHTVEELEEMLN